MSADERIQVAIATALKNQGVSQAALARKLEVSPQSLNQIVLRRKATIPQSLIDVLDALGLELVVQPRKRD